MTSEDVGKIKSAQDAGERPDVPAETLAAFERMREDDGQRLRKTIAGLDKTLWDDPVEKLGKTILDNLQIPKIEPPGEAEKMPLTPKYTAPRIPQPDYASLSESMEESQREREQAAADERNRDQMMLEATIELAKLTRQQNARHKAQARLDGIAQKKARTATWWSVAAGGLAAAIAGLGVWATWAVSGG
ncbi:hypothetical protein [Citricoccus sp. GCM10030269]|uniref:hypothetical protein n=1 Tax=Citricoccus sp. GCM10030269 TaxID=3273388 RepID=UPI00366B135D